LHAAHSPEFTYEAARAIAVQAIHLFDLMYDRAVEVSSKERSWRDALLDSLDALTDEALAPEVAASVPDYPRTQISDDFSEYLFE
jgi:hypothetical protein